MPELKQLKYLTVCAETGSFSRASEQLGTTQPNVSRVIRELEEELGVPLFVRKGHGIAMTEEGARVGRIAKRVLRTAELLQEAAESGGTACFSAAAVGGRAVAQAMAAFCRRHIDTVVFRYLVGDTDFVQRQVENYQAEIGLVTISVRHLSGFQYLLSRRHLEFHSLRTGGVAVSFGRPSPFGKLTSVGCEELKQVRFIRSADDRFSLENHVAALFSDAALRRVFDRAIVTNSGHAMAELLRSVPGLCHLNTLSPGGEHRGGLRTLPIDGCEDSVVFGYLKREKEELSEYALELIQSV
ncbi:MAG: LysR family transcriptional regulator [Oscillospiraceae bacterium]|nr:LysR family transcriptional regulator [Oscillospiraceae bacterium]